tara:strand:+ start:217 stop:564 length:348 start_codon:yes stop_codon:yes gene_type:complete
MAKEPIEMLPVIGRLRDHGVLKVVSEFDGEGDSGEIYETVFYDIDDEEINIKVSNELEDFIYDKIAVAVNTYGGDWVNNAGGFGNIILYLDDFTVECNYHQRTTDDYNWSSSIFT